MFFGLNCRTQVKRAKSGRGGQENDITGFDHLFVGVQSKKLVILVNSDPMTDLRIGDEVLQAAVDLLLKHVRNSHQANVRIGSQCLFGRARTTSSTPHEANLQLITTRRKYLGIECKIQTQRAGEHCVRFDKVPS